MLKMGVNSDCYSVSLLKTIFDDRSDVMKISARNLVDRKTVRVENDNIMAMVQVETPPAMLTSIITRESVDDLNLKVGDNAKTMVKSTVTALRLGYAYPANRLDKPSRFFIFSRWSIVWKIRLMLSVDNWGDASAANFSLMNP
jgi:molybdopterin-binding protein